MSGTPEGRIGYIGVDVLNNATICNEILGLRDKQVEAEWVSVYAFDKATYFKDPALADLAEKLPSLYPLRPLRAVYLLLMAPFVFRMRLLKTVFKAATGPVEGTRERLKMLAHIVPAILLATMWRKRNVRHIHAQWAHTATTIAMHAAELLGISFSFTGHANDLFVHRVGLVDKVRRARFIVCISEYHRRFYLGLGAHPDRLRVVYCGISMDRFNDQQSSRRGRQRIVSIGRLVEKKGFHVLIEACSLLKQRGVPFECIIAGSGPEEQRLNRLIKGLHLEDDVRVTGRPVIQEEMPDLLATARLFALPCVRDSDGDMDGLPQVLIESMACGVPAVSTFLVGIPDLVRHEVNGLLTETDNAAACANAMERLLLDDELVEQFATEGSRWVRAHFGRDQLVQRLERLLTWAAANPGFSIPEWDDPAAPGSDACYQHPTYYDSTEQTDVAATTR